MSVKKIIKESLLKEADVNPTRLPSIQNREPGATAALARAQYLQNKVEKNLSSMGVYGVQGYMEEQGIFSLERIKGVGKFPFSFKTKDGNTYSGEVEFNKNYSQLFQTIALTFVGTGVKLLIVFEKNSINRPFMAKGISDSIFPKSGKKRTIKGLQEDEIFPVLIFTEKDVTGKTGNQIKNMGKKPTQIKITEIGIQKSTKEKYSLFSKKEYVQVKGSVKITSGDIKSLENRVTADKIQTLLNNGVFFVRLSEKEPQTIVLSDKPSLSGEFLVIESDDYINEAEPQEWTNINVTIGKNAMGNYSWPNVKGVVKYLRPIK